MGEHSNISWTDATFNAWMGCARKSPGCINCYAEIGARRNPAVLGVWGVHGTRPVAAESTWKNPERWNRKAQKTGVRIRVFTNSIADVFEDRAELHEPRLRLFGLIRNTPYLDWLLLTKEPENIIPSLRMARDMAYNRSIAVHSEIDKTSVWLNEWALGRNPSNVHLGTSVENHDYLWRIDALANVAAAVRFLSLEPLLEMIDIRSHLATGRIDQVIVGGESTTEARPFNLLWARSILSQCRKAGVPFWFKQTGSNVHNTSLPISNKLTHTNWKPLSLKGDDPKEWPIELRVQEEATRR